MRWVLHIEYRFKVVMCVLVLMIWSGTFLFHFIEGWQLTDAFYYSIVTLATVGYGDFVPVTTAGKLLSACYICVSFLMIFGILDGLSHKHAKRIQEKMRKN